MDFLRFALRYAYSRRMAAGYIFLCCAVSLLVFFFRGVPVRVPLALMLLSLAPVLVFEVRRLLFLYQKHLTLNELPEISDDTLEELESLYPPDGNMDDGDYQTLLHRCLEEAREAQEAAPPDNREAVEYYSLWAREIKAPIGAMKQLLLTGDSPLVRRASIQLHRVERYAEMAVVYALLEGASAGYAFRRYDLASLVERATDGFTGELVEKQLTLTFEPVPAFVVTDAKWLLFVLEQILSNALEHTYSGGITVFIERGAGPKAVRGPELDDADDRDSEEETSRRTEESAPAFPPALLISDTGTGIPPDELPRLFERGPAPTGQETPEGGLGLYLCHRICENLGHTLSVTSTEGEGTCVRLDFSVRLDDEEDEEDEEEKTENASGTEQPVK